MPGLQDPGSRVILVVSAGDLLCGLPVQHVMETMRPQPIRRVGTPAVFVRGLSVIRGSPMPVVDLAELLGSPNPITPTRFVSVRAAGQCLALAVSRIQRLCTLDTRRFEEMPPLLGGGSAALEAIGTLDSGLLLLIGTSRIIPAETWESLGMAEG